MASVLEQLSAEMADLHTRVQPGFVQIRRDGKPLGAGVVWRADGLILTSAHVVERRGRRAGIWRAWPDLSVVLADARLLPAGVLAVDPATDLAILKIDARGLQPIPPGDSEALRAGEVLLAFGFPYGAEGGATLGVVVTPVGALPESRRREGQWLAASLHLRPGHSGGPMVDASGRLVGINTFMNGPHVGVAVPVRAARAFLARAGEAFRRAAEARGAEQAARVTEL